MQATEAYSQPCETSKMEIFVEKLNAQENPSFFFFANSLIHS